MGLPTDRSVELSYSPSRALAELKAQHDALRELMDRCEALVDELDAGTGSSTHLTREVAKLRLAFDAHNTCEERLLRPILHGHDAFAEIRIDRMIEDHVGEHRVMRAQLDVGDPNGLRDVLRDTLEMLRAHLDAEERYLLSTNVLRDHQ